MGKTKERRYRIGEVVELLGKEYPDLTASTIRFWERNSVLVPSQATEGGQRAYTERDVYRVQIIKELARGGVRLAVIKDWLRECDRQLKNRDPSPFFPELFPSLVRFIRRRRELEQEVAKFLSLDGIQQQEPLYTRNLLIKSAGKLSFNRRLIAPFWVPPKERRRKSWATDAAIEQAKEERLAQLERMGFVRPGKQTGTLLYSETDRMIFVLTFFLGKAGKDFQFSGKVRSCFRSFGIPSELPWADERGRIRLENVLFNLVLDRCSKEPFLKDSDRTDSKTNLLSEMLNKV